MVTTSKVHDALLDQPLSISLLLNDGSRLVTGQKFVYRPDPTFTSIEPLNHLITYVTRSSAIAVIADRTACSILTLFIAIATSRPLNKKKIRSLSVRGSNNYYGSASAIRSPHISATPAGCSRTVHGTVLLLTN